MPQVQSTIAILNSASKLFLLLNTGREEQGDRGGGAERGRAEAQDGAGDQPQQGCQISVISRNNLEYNR